MNTWCLLDQIVSNKTHKNSTDILLHIIPVPLKLVRLLNIRPVVWFHMQCQALVLVP